MKVFRAAAMIALLSWPVCALGQEAPVRKYGDEQKAKTPNEIAEERATDKAYKNSLSNIPDKGPVDPWGNARAAEAPKDATKDNMKSTKAAAAKTAAKPKMKPVSTVN